MMHGGVCGEVALDSPEIRSNNLGARMRVLVVDDDEAVRSSFALALAGLDYDLALAENGREGLEYIAHNEVDLVFLDLRMPGLDGVRTLRLLREQQEDTKVCILSAFVEEHMDSLIDLASERLDFEVFRKPLDMDEIRALTLTLAGAPPGSSQSNREPGHPPRSKLHPVKPRMSRH